MTEVRGERVFTRVPFRDLGFTNLFSDYCDAVPEAVSFFGSHFLDRHAVERSLLKARSVNVERRSTLVTVLREQNERWRAPEKTFENIRLLGSDQSACVITGQQLGLFVSPLYTIYKSLTAIRLAAEWSADGKPVVPVFWLADEDHDLEEIAHCFVPDGDAGAVEVSYPEKYKGNDVPTGRLILEHGIVEILDQLETLLGGAPDAGFVMDGLRSAYKPGVSYSDAFASFLHVMLPDSGLIIISGDDARLKRIAVPLFKRAVAEADLLNQVLQTSSNDIAMDYHAQLHLRNTNLFVIQDGRRLGLDRTDSGFVIDGNGSTLTLEEVLSRVDREPESISPNVVLRPLYQDSILPTAAYVGGPGEVAYFGQIRAAYEWAQVHMPIIYPRASLSIVDGSASRLIDAHKLSFPNLRKRPEALFGELVSGTMSQDAESILSGARNGIDDALSGVVGPVRAVDATLEASVEAIRVTFQKRLMRLEKKILREEKRKHALLEDRVIRTTSFLFPHGKPQERMILPAYFLARYGRDFFVRLLDDVDVDTSQHLVIRS